MKEVSLMPSCIILDTKTEIKETPRAIVNWLSGQKQLSEIGFFTEPPKAWKSERLHIPSVVVSLESYKFEKRFTVDHDGMTERPEPPLFATLNMRFDVYVPFAEGGDRCYYIFSQILDLFNFTIDFNPRSCDARDVSAKRDMDAFFMEGLAELDVKLACGKRFCPHCGKELPYEPA